MILIVVCLSAAAFGGGAVTSAQLSDGETATVSAAAGHFDVCEAGEIVTYEFSRESDELEHVSGPDIITFSNYDYRRGFFTGPTAVDAVDFEATEPIQQVRYRLRYGGSRTERFRSPVTRGDLGSSGWFRSPFVGITLTCADGDNDAGGTWSVSIQRSESESNSPNGSVAAARSSGDSVTTNETPAFTTEDDTEKSEDSLSNSSETTSVTESTENTTGTSTTPSTRTETQTAASVETSTVRDSSTTTSPERTTETQTGDTETATSANTTEATTKSPDTSESNEMLSDKGDKGLLGGGGRQL